MTITITKSAAQHVKSMLDKRGQGLGLRLSTEVSGCSGFAYVVDYADTINEDDIVIEDHGVKVVINDKSLPNLKGIRIDYIKQNALNQGFEFNNPQVKDMCGCGVSFSV